MWYTGEIIMKSYLPSELEEGMLFVNRISVGILEPYVELWELDDDIPEDIDLFMAKHGAPIELYIVDCELQNIIAYGDEFGWWDEGYHTEDLREITLDDINLILKDHEGYVEIEMEEDDDSLFPVYYDEKILLRLPEEDDDWDETLNDGLEEEF